MTDHMQVMCVAGARPNFMKIGPIVTALDKGGVRTLLVHTGQHYDELMSDVFFEDLGLRLPDEWLGVGSGSHAGQTAGAMIGIERLICRYRPDVVVVVGDVNSTLGAALATAKGSPLLAHVEAGLRSGDRAMPEEINRVLTDQLSDFLFAPSAEAVQNLRREGVVDERVHLVGDVMAETLLTCLERASKRPILQELGLTARAYAVVTIHRAHNVDHLDTLTRLMGALEELAADVPLVFPIHPRTSARISEGGVEIPRNVTILPPLRYLDFIALEANASLVLTDSGSIQEETSVLGVPCLTLRDTTERPETLRNDGNRLVGTDPDRIISAARRVLATNGTPGGTSPAPTPTGQRIADELVSSIRGLV